MKNTLLVIILLIQMPISIAGNLFEPSSGELLIPALTVKNQSYSAMFELTGEKSLEWGTNVIGEGAVGARTAATYDAGTGTLWVPEINIRGKLYSLGFNVSTACGYTLCVQADSSTLQANGRYGADVFTKPVSDASTFSCSSCHAMNESNGLASDGLRRPGHPLMEAINRPDYKNGKVESLLEAVNSCLTEWMNASAWTEDDSDWINLENWFADQSSLDSGEAATVAIDIVDIPEDLSGGDGENGRTLFNSSCLVCHGFDGDGTVLAPKITGTGLQAEYIANRVRKSGLPGSAVYDGLTGGIMPFWGADRLSDEELIDIVAYVSNRTEGNLDMGVDDPILPSDSGCTMASTKIGQTASLSNLFHDVEGTVTIIDDCTLEITGFSFDGGGIDVRLYAGDDGRFFQGQGGFALSEDLVGIAYNDNTLRLTVPEGKTLDDFNSISVWCVAVGISFGTGFFE